MFVVNIQLTSGQKISYKTATKGRTRLEGWLSSNVDEREFYVARSSGDVQEAYYIRRRDISGVEIYQLENKSSSSGIGFLTNR